jgi:hypothetical protein
LSADSLGIERARDHETALFCGSEGQEELAVADGVSLAHDAKMPAAPMRAKAAQEFVRRPDAPAPGRAMLAGSSTG